MDKLAKESLLWLAIIGGAYFLYDKITGSAGAAISSVADSIAGALSPDVNAPMQTRVQQILAALKANGSPRVGSDNYNAIMLQFNRPDLVVNNALTGQGGG